MRPAFWTLNLLLSAFLCLDKKKKKRHSPLVLTFALARIGMEEEGNSSGRMSFEVKIQTYTCNHLLSLISFFSSSFLLSSCASPINTSPMIAGPTTKWTTPRSTSTKPGPTQPPLRQASSRISMARTPMEMYSSSLLLLGLCLRLYLPL